MIVTRFAPSPNGALHMGHAFSAIVAHDLAKGAGGRFLVRIEDIDRERSRPELVDEFRRDLEWLGLEWGDVPAQSARFERYHALDSEQFGSIRKVLYPCRCTRSQIAAAATRTGPDGPIYPGTCRTRDIGPDTSDCSWRLDIAKAIEICGPLEWSDQLVGVQQATPEIFGDPVIFRKDGWPSYHFAVTLDDADDGVTLVTRGVDLFAASHVHRLVQALMGLPVPQWHHHPLLLDATGAKLAKRRGSPSLADRREAGEDGLVLAEALRAHRFPAGISLSASLHDQT